METESQTVLDDITLIEQALRFGNTEVQAAWTRVRDRAWKAMQRERMTLHPASMPPVYERPEDEPWPTSDDVEGAWT